MSEVSADWNTASAWVEKELGGRVVSPEKLPRWRPCWNFDLEREGERLPLHFRGDRGRSDHGVYPLEHEMRVLQLLGEQGLRVPKLYGFCPEPRGIVMERCPGRPDLGTAESRAEQEAVLDDYLEQLARIHSIEAPALEGLGLEAPKGDVEIALADFDRWESTYRKEKRRPEPLLEFVIGWVRRNAPASPAKLSLLHGDSGQLIFEKGHMTAMLDFELACLGDPAADLAAMRCRDIFEPLGNLARGFQRYAEATGKPIDVATVSYHTARFAICTALSTAHLVAEPHPGLDLALYREWYTVMGRLSLDAICECTGIEVEPVLVPPPRVTTRSAAYEVLVAGLGGHERCEPYEQDVLRRIACYLEQVERIGPQLEAQDLDEVAALLGSRPDTPEQSDAELEALVLRAEPKRDAELIRHLMRRQQRLELQIGAALRRVQNLNLQPVAL
jgi:aminoglycoside phosphotransferase (APT) family kinase protein